MPQDEIPSIRFGPFELDRHSGELRRDGAKVPVQDKPVRILEALTERPGVVVTREQLRRRLWSADTFVDFDNGLNNAINRLRTALGDDASKPNFVETVGRRGYRFIARVREAAASASSGRAYALYLRANHLSENPTTLVRARDLYLESLAEDATYAPAWARLARAYRFMAKFELDATPECLQLAQESAARALALNPELSLAHYVHAQLELESGRVRAALGYLFDRVRIHRHDPHLFAALVQACRYGGLLDASIAADQRARELEPALRTSVGYSYWMAGDSRRALDEARRIGDMSLGLLLIATGNLEEARSWLAAAAHQYTGFNVPLAYIRSLAAFVDGDRDSSVSAADSVYRRSGFSDSEGLYYVAMVMMWNGDHDRALSVLSRAVSRGFACLPGLDIDAVWRPLRARSAFRSLLDQVGQRHSEIEADFDRIGGAALVACSG